MRPRDVDRTDDRLSAAFSELVMTKGLSRTTVGEVVALARTSRREFYRRYARLDDCLLALVGRSVDSLEASLGTLRPDEAGPGDQLRRGVELLVEWAEANPATVVAMVADLPCLPRGFAIRRVMLVRIAELLGVIDAGPDDRAATMSGSGAVGVAIVAGVLELLAHAVSAGTPLGGLVDDILTSCLSLPATPSDGQLMSTTTLPVDRRSAMSCRARSICSSA